MALLFLIFFFVPSHSLYFFTPCSVLPHHVRSYTLIHSHARTHPAAHIAGSPALSFLELYYKALCEYLHTRAYERKWCAARVDDVVRGWRRKEESGANRRRSAKTKTGGGGGGRGEWKNNLIGFKNYWFLHFLKVQLMASVRRPHRHCHQVFKGLFPRLRTYTHGVLYSIFLTLSSFFVWKLKSPSYRRCTWYQVPYECMLYIYSKTK